MNLGLGVSCRPFGLPNAQDIAKTPPRHRQDGSRHPSWPPDRDYIAPRLPQDAPRPRQDLPETAPDLKKHRKRHGFSMILVLGCRAVPSAFKRPRHRQDTAKTAQDTHLGLQTTTRLPQDCPKTPQDRAKTCPKPPQTFKNLENQMVFL